MQDLKLSRLNKLREKGSQFAGRNSTSNGNKISDATNLQPSQQNLAQKLQYTSFIHSFVGEKTPLTAATHTPMQMAKTSTDGFNHHHKMSSEVEEADDMVKMINTQSDHITSPKHSAK